ncbi:putative nucleoredoxin 1 isoform X1 [Apium graveolens]|uniref:putative nucleoredoxin 1 isoform X1 n=1 Tax=Apium graveolens TaxID=4045 RepID=UPI003D7B3557
MALSGGFSRGIRKLSRSIECNKSFLRHKSSLTAPKLFVSGVSLWTTDEMIREAFARFGNLVEAKIVKDRFSGLSKGFAIVTYDNIQEAEKARTRMNLRPLGDSVVFVQSEREFLKQEPEPEPVSIPKPLYTVRVDFDDLDESQGVLDLSTEDKLREAFAPFGNVLEARILRAIPPYTHLKGSALVRYGTKEEAEKAQDALDDNRLGHHTVDPVEPNKFKPSEQKKMHLFTKSIHYPTEAEAEAEVKKQIIKKGDIINLKDLLFTKNRDYLVRNNNEHIKAEQLEGKVIVLYFMPLYVDYPQHSEDFTSFLKDVYYDLLPNNNFEVVLVANQYRHAGYNRIIIGQPSRVRDPQELFEDLFSSMPWTAIPYSDVVTRKNMQRLFGSGVHKENFPLTNFVVDSTGMVLQCNDWVIFDDFGASGYPFSDERLEVIRAEDDAAAKQPSLKTLLATRVRDYVISNKDDKVPIDALEDKVVALYFYHAKYANHYLTETLRFAKTENKDKFEVVLIYVAEPALYDCKSNSEESFWKVLKTMPWLALPFRDECCRKLRRVFKLLYNYEEDPNELVIIGPHAELVEPHGASILLEYGISAYPFTFKKAVELETEKIKHLKLEMLWDKNTVFRRNNGSQVSFSELLGKRVILILERIGGGWESDFSERSPNAHFLIMLKGRYLLTKGTDDEFEVIRILADNLEFSTSVPFDSQNKRCLASPERELGDNNWISCRASELKENICSSNYWYGRSIDDFYLFLPVLAFNRDGRLVRKVITPSFEVDEFPFYAGGLENEMLSQLTELMTRYTLF